MLLAGCVSSNSNQPVNDTLLPTATTLPFLQDIRSPLPDQSSVPDKDTTPVSSVPNADSVPDVATTQTGQKRQLHIPIVAAPTAATDRLAAGINRQYNVFIPVISGSVDLLGTIAAPSQDEQIDEIVVYNETLDPNWTVEHSQGMRYNLSATDYVLNGKTTIAITPTVDFGQFFLAVREDTDIPYARDRILGVSFWLNGGENDIATDELAVTVLGSNAYTHWVATDKSAQIDAGIPDDEITADTPLFSETRLYYLDINRTIPPDTWVEVIVWLDNLSYDPLYDYVTGIYIKNGEGFLNTFYIDRISLLLAE